MRSLKNPPPSGAESANVSKTATQEKARELAARREELMSKFKVWAERYTGLTAIVVHERAAAWEGCKFAESLSQEGAAELQKENAEIAKALGIHFCPDLEEPWEVPMEPEPDYFETLSEAAAFVYAVLDKGLSDREKENARLREALERLSKVSSASLFEVRAFAKVALSKEKVK